MSKTITSSELTKFGIAVAQDGAKKSAYQLLGLPNFGIEKIKKIFTECSELDQGALNYLYIESKYSMYLKRQSLDIKLFKSEEECLIPEDLNYMDIESLSLEVREKLAYHKPSTIGSARRIPGITPTALTAIIIYLKTKYLKK